MKTINMDWMKELLDDYETDQGFDYEITLSNETRERGQRLLRKLCQQIEEYTDNNHLECVNENKHIYTGRDINLVKFEGLRKYLDPYMCKYISYAGINANLFPHNTTYQKMTKDLYKRYLGIDDDVVLDELEQYKVSRLDLGWPPDIEIENEYQYKLRLNKEKREERKRQLAEYRKKKKNMTKPS